MSAPKRVLALHGYGGTFGSKLGSDALETLTAELRTRGLEIEFVAPSAPNKVGDKDPAWLAGDQEPLGKYVGFSLTDGRIKERGLDAEPEAWTEADLPPALSGEESIWQGSEGVSRSLELLEAEWRSGSFDGILGFSQGGFTAALFCAHLQVNRPELPPPRFAITCGSFAKPVPQEVAAWWPRAEPMQIPSLHSAGELDTIVAPFRSEELAAQFAQAQVFRHSLVGHPRAFGGHVVPWDSGDRPGGSFADAVASLIRASCAAKP